MKHDLPIILRAATVILRNADGKLLLLLRDDMPLWEITGGEVEEHETFEQAAIREVQEETGQMVKLDRFVGDYYVPHEQGLMHIQCFISDVNGFDAVLEDQIDFKWFALEEIPLNFSRNHHERIMDAFKKNSPVKKYQDNSLKRIDYLRTLRMDQMHGLDFWKSHPAVQKKKGAGLLKYWPA